MSFGAVQRAAPSLPRATQSARRHEELEHDLLEMTATLKLSAGMYSFVRAEEVLQLAREAEPPPIHAVGKMVVRMGGPPSAPQPAVASPRKIKPHRSAPPFVLSTAGAAEEEDVRCQEVDPAAQATAVGRCAAEWS